MKIKINDLTPDANDIKLVLTENLHFYHTIPFWGGSMKIKVKCIKSEEILQRFGNKFFTKEQIKQIRSI